MELDFIIWLSNERCGEIKKLKTLKGRSKMKKTLIVMAVIAASALVAAETATSTIVATDFSTSEKVDELFKLGGPVDVKDGKLNMPSAGIATMKKELPQEFTVKVKITFNALVADKQGFAGFLIDDMPLMLNSKGTTHVQYSPKGDTRTHGKYIAVEGFELNKPVTLTVIRQKVEGGYEHTFTIDKQEIGKFYAPGSEKAPAVVLYDTNENVSFDDFEFTPVCK